MGSFLFGGRRVSLVSSPCAGLGGVRKEPRRGGVGEAAGRAEKWPWGCLQAGKLGVSRCSAPVTILDYLPAGKDLLPHPHPTPGL